MDGGSPVGKDGIFSITPSQGGAPIPESPQSLFEGSVDPSRAPKIIYPNDGILVPPNLGQIEVHWLTGSSTNSLFEISFKNSATTVRIYTRCEKPQGVQDDGCIAGLDSTVWQSISYGTAAAEPLTLTIRGTDDQGSGVGASAAQTMILANTEIQGAIYYWTTSKKTTMRFDFASTDPKPETAVDNALAQNTARCFGCHALSSDGTKLITSAKGSAGGFMLYSFEQNKALVNHTSDTDNIIAFATFNPDASKVATVSNDKVDASKRATTGIRLFDTRCDSANLATCGSELPSISLGGAVVTHPEWSPDGTQIVFAQAHDPTKAGTPWSPTSQGISYIESANGTWSAPKSWVAYADGYNRYAPTYAPNASFIVYAESKCPIDAPDDATCDGNTDPSAKLWGVERGKTTPIELIHANAPGPLDKSNELENTFPKFSPFTSEYRGPDGADSLMWITFGSTRNYGLRPPPIAPGSNPPVTSLWIWMVAIRPSQLEKGLDPSYPAFVLPYQDFTTSNHMAVWTKRVVTPL